MSKLVLDVNPKNRKKSNDTGKEHKAPNKKTSMSRTCKKSRIENYNDDNNEIGEETIIDVDNVNT